ncbi:hypothetical protein GFS03_04890 [Sulfolobus sp. E5-1-F]|uniref:RAMP superfamily CRISPR-associated protein n=1 Tax=Saccharolobus sp. E5-1-F TaxID=2663019 RepID=UPI00129544F0|nr:RAMP superfamily CRISPR-associated protein [Sulfolobus sp. E5-1-F]QGA53960.1 hypothetical protein GFS03_04890 [Sulfolobus sp. E5-1-F]
MTDYYLFFIRNETPLVVNYASGNYFKSLDYIPASSIIGAVKSRSIKNWGGPKEDFDLGIKVSDAYPSSIDQTTLNPAGLVTLYKDNERDNYYVDGLSHILNTIMGKSKWGEKTIRLKKGPQHWIYLRDKAYSIPIERIETTILKLDEYTKNPLIRGKNEREGYIAHVEAIYPGQIFSFIASGKIEVLEESLKEGIYVGSFKTKGYGLIKLVNKKEFTLNQCDDEICVLDFYGNVSYETYEKIKNECKGKIIYENVTFDKRKRFDYDTWKIDIVVRSGSIMVVRNCKLNLEQENGGVVIVNHPIHNLS